MDYHRVHLIVSVCNWPLLELCQV